MSAPLARGDVDGADALQVASSPISVSPEVMVHPFSARTLLDAANAAWRAHTQA
jgi:hypothetical protein